MIEPPIACGLFAYWSAVNIGSTQKKRTRLTPTDRRRQLVEIGASLFAKRPFSDVWIEEVAAQAGVSRGLIYHYFPNKRDFYAAVVQRSVESAIRISEPDESLPPLEQLRLSLAQFLTYVEANEDGFRAVHRGQHSADQEIRSVMREARDMQANRILHYLEPVDGSSATLSLAIEGWMNFNNSVILDWLEARTIDRDVLLDLMTDSLVGILTAAIHADGSEMPMLLAAVQERTAALA